MAGRRTYPWPTLAVVAVLAVAPAARAVDILRLKPTDEKSSPVTIDADHNDTWTEGTDQVYALTGRVVVRQGKTVVTAGRAVVWVGKTVHKDRRAGPVIVYADTVGKEAVGVAADGRARREAEAAVVEFVTPAVAWVHGEQRLQSAAQTDLYRRGLAARGLPVPPLPKPERKDKPVSPAQFETPGKGEPPDAGSDQPPAVTGPTIIPVPLTETRSFAIAPRTTRPFNIYPVITGTDKAAIVTGGIKLSAKFTTGSLRNLEMEADEAVIWQKGRDVGPAVSAMQAPGGAEGADGVEVYLCGNVVIRYGGAKDMMAQPGGVVGLNPREARTMRADRVYYDVSNHKAIAVNADLEYTREGFVNTGHVVAPEVDQLSSTEFTAFEAVIHASRLPSDPGFTLNIGQADIFKAPRRARRTIFGLPFRDRRTGQVAEEEPELLEARRMSMRVLGIPIFYLPRLQTNLNDPLGPFRGVTFRQDRIFGYQAYATWDMLELVGLTKLEGERWNLLTDYLSLRGPALGTVYNRTSQTFMGMQAPFQTLVKGYTVDDRGTDVLGGPREKDFQGPAKRGRLLWQYQQQFTLSEPEDLIFQGQFAYLSDRNFLEQYFNNEYNFGPNQETFAFGKYQSGNSAFTLLAQADTGQNWLTRTYWMPKAEGYLLGQSLFERFTWHSWASAGWARLDTFRLPPSDFPLLPGATTGGLIKPVGEDNGFPPPERNTEAGRVDWMQRISAPFHVGALNVAPYGVLDLAYYTDSNRADPQGRVYGGGGVRASVPLSKLYPDVTSDLFNLCGLYHKNTFSANYFIAGSNVSWAVLPQLDRLNDDATENAWRDITPWQSVYTNLGPKVGQALQLGSYNKFNPREYAIRRLVDSNPDTLDDIQVVQLDWRQRLQTKRGYPGLEHTVDWLTLDLSGSIFPAANRDNFGVPVGFLEGYLMWNVGDRTNVYANGWLDPFEYGARYWEVGTNFYRDDRTAFTLSYKEVQPLASRLVIASATYVFSPKYAVTGVTAYDFGYNASLSNSLLFTRVGTDLQITVGFTYNSLVRNFGFTINIIPNLFANQAAPGGQPTYGSAGGPGGYGSGAGRR